MRVCIVCVHHLFASGLRPQHHRSTPLQPNAVRKSLFQPQGLQLLRLLIDSAHLFIEEDKRLELGRTELGRSHCKGQHLRTVSQTSSYQQMRLT